MFPLPGLKLREGGGYTICPKCVLIWLGVIMAGLFLWTYYRRARKEVGGDG